jgi:hypothetical protein
MSNLLIHYKTLRLSNFFDKELKDIPDDTKIIIFEEYSNFNQEIKENILPINLHTLIFGNYFNKKIKENVLPINLHTLNFGWNFNQEIKENVLPINLHTLTFGWNFNQIIKENVLPNNLHTLIFGNHYNQEIKENVLPINLHILKLGYNFNQEIKENVLPKSITQIGLYSHCNLINNLPSHIEEAHILFTYNEHDYMNNKITNLPITLKKIIIDFEYQIKYLTKIPFGCIVEIKKKIDIDE